MNFSIWTSVKNSIKQVWHYKSTIATLVILHSLILLAIDLFARWTMSTNPALFGWFRPQILTIVYVVFSFFCFNTYINAQDNHQSVFQKLWRFSGQKFSGYLIVGLLVCLSWVGAAKLSIVTVNYLMKLVGVAEIFGLIVPMIMFAAVGWSGLLTRVATFGLIKGIYLLPIAIPFARIIPILPLIISGKTINIQELWYKSSGSGFRTTMAAVVVLIPIMCLYSMTGLSSQIYRYVEIDGRVLVQILHFLKYSVVLLGIATISAILTEQFKAVTSGSKSRSEFFEHVKSEGINDNWIEILRKIFAIRYLYAGKYIRFNKTGILLLGVALLAIGYVGIFENRSILLTAARHKNFDYTVTFSLTASGRTYQSSRSVSCLGRVTQAKKRAHVSYHQTLRQAGFELPDNNYALVPYLPKFCPKGGADGKSTERDFSNGVPINEMRIWLWKGPGIPSQFTEITSTNASRNNIALSISAQKDDKAKPFDREQDDPAIAPIEASLKSDVSERTRKTGKRSIDYRQYLVVEIDETVWHGIPNISESFATVEFQDNAKQHFKTGNFTSQLMQVKPVREVWRLFRMKQRPIDVGLSKWNTDDGSIVVRPYKVEDGTIKPAKHQEFPSTYFRLNSNVIGEKPKGHEFELFGKIFTVGPKWVPNMFIDPNTRRIAILLQRREFLRWATEDKRY